MATDVERLVAVLEMRANQFERALKRAEGQADRHLRGIERRTDRMERKVKASFNSAARSVAAFGKGLAFGGLGGLAGLAGGAAIIQKTTDAIADFDAIAKKARDAGLDSDFYQAITFGAGEASISQDKLNTALTAFTRNAGLAAAGKGELVEKLKVLNPELLKSIQNAKTQEERFKLVAEAVRKAGSATEKAAIATSVFGEGGGELVRVLDKGADGLDAMADKAERLGLIVDRKLLQQAEELQNEYGNLTAVIDTQLKQAFIDLAPVLNDVARAAAQVAKFIAAIADSYRDLEHRTGTGLDRRAAELRKALADREKLGLSGPQYTGRGAQSEGQMRQELRDIALETLKRKMAQDASEQALPAVVTGGSSGGGGGSSSRKAAITDAERLKQRVDDLVASLRFEAEQLTRTSDEQEIYNNLNRVGVDAASAEGQAISAATQALQAKRAEIEANQQALERARETGEAFGSAISTALGSLAEGGEDARKVMLRLALDIGRAVIQAQLLNRVKATGGGGGFAQGLLGSLLGGLGRIPAFAEGTPYVPKTGLALVHEGEAVIPAVMNRRGAAGGNAVTINQTFPITGAVSSKDVERMVARGSAASVEQVKRELPGWQVRSRTNGALG